MLLYVNIPQSASALATSCGRLVRVGLGSVSRSHVQYYRKVQKSWGSDSDMYEFDVKGAELLGKGAPGSCSVGTSS